MIKNFFFFNRPVSDKSLGNLIREKRIYAVIEHERWQRGIMMNIDENNTQTHIHVEQWKNLGEMDDLNHRETETWIGW